MAEKITALRDRVGAHTPDLTDRRRLVVSATLMVAEKNHGAVPLGLFGECVLNNALPNNEQDIMDLSDSATRRLNQIAAGF